jgi:hypothetical protein
MVVSMFKKYDHNTFENFYNKYSAVMYGVINSIAPNKSVADQILIDAFLDIKENNLFIDSKENHYINILKYTFNFSIKQLMLLGVVRKECEYFLRHNIMHLLCTTCTSIKEVASLLEVSEAETIKQLQLEMLTFRPDVKKQKSN